MKLGFIESRALELELGPTRLGKDPHIEVRFRVRRFWLPFLFASMIDPWWARPFCFVWAAWHFWVRWKPSPGPCFEHDECRGALVCRRCRP